MRVSDGSRQALYHTLSIECPSSIFFLEGVFYYCSFLFVVSVSFRYVFFCSCWSFVDVPLIFFCPADQVPDWQPRILLGMVEARSVNVKKTTTTSHLFWTSDYTFGLMCGRTSRDHTGGRPHRSFFLRLPSAVLALFLIARMIQPSLSLIDREVEFCVLTKQSFSTCWA